MAGVSAAACIWRWLGQSETAVPTVAPPQPTIVTMDNDDETSGPFDQDEVGKIKDRDSTGVIEDKDLLAGERQLKESIAQREREQDRYPRGSPNGNRDDRENYRQYQNHQREIDEDKKWLAWIQRRIENAGL